MKLPRWLLVGLILALGSAIHAQVPPDKALSTFTVADGLELQLWASEPLFVNPTCIDIDHRGRVWVCESVNYRCHLRKQPLRRPEGDRIVILEDSKGTGKADKVTVFYQAPDLIAPLGIAVAAYPSPDRKGGFSYKVYVCHSPDILVFEDKDGDGKADGPPKKLLSGFNGHDHDHGVHGISIGPDGKLYFSVGDTGVKDLQSSDGKGRKWTSNTTDCRAGTIWRCDLDGKNLELIAHNFRNEYEPCVDSFGTIFVSDNDDDGNQQTRICYVMPGGNYGYHPRGPGQSHWHEEQPGVVPKILRTGFGSPTGMCVYEGTLLPKKYQGQLLHTDAGPREVRCYHLKPKGAGYAVEPEILVSSTDTWFRPSDVCVAPDGSAFIADWYDPGVGGHGIGDLTRGRIYRLAPKGSKPTVSRVDLESKKGLLAALKSPALSVRYMAIQKIDRLKEAFEEVAYLLEDAIVDRVNPWLRARASWLICHHPGFKKNAGYSTLNEAEVDRAIWDEVYEVLFVRIEKEVFLRLSEMPRAGREQYRQKLHAKSLTAMRRELLLALRDDSPAFAKDWIWELAKQYDGHDRFYLAAIGIAVGHHDQKRRDIILADFDKYFPEWNDKVADLVWELRPSSVLATLDKRLNDKKLSAAQQARIIDILAGSDDSSAGKALLRILQTDAPTEVKQRAVENLQRFLPGKWRALRSSPEVKGAIDRLLGSANGRKAGLSLIAAVERTDAVAKVAELASDDKQLLAVRREAVRTLGLLPVPQAVTPLEALLTKPGPLARDVVAALGAHAPIYGEKPGTRAALKALQGVLLAPAGDADLKQAALEALSGSRAGTTWLLDAHAQKKLPAAMVADAGRLLRNSPFEDLRSRALHDFPLPARIDPSKLPSIAVLITRKGDPLRGKQILAASAKNDMQCLKCHTVLGTGGQIGPDLSAIGKKASRENLLESILLPSKAIADQYLSWVIATNNGLVLTGLLVEETHEFITLRDANGKDTKIAKKDIESRAKDAKSLMPDNLIATLTEDELLDLVEYLMTLKQEDKASQKK